MTGQTLGRRNTALVQSTELDLVSWMLDRHDKERLFCTPQSGCPQEATVIFFVFARNRRTTPTPSVDGTKHVD
jgi:hypothetical protein